MIPVKITQLSTNENPIHRTLDVGWVEKYKTVTGNPIVISDGVKDTLLTKLLVTLEPKQSGSGTPSPSNIRPISGWDEVETHKAGVNLFTRDGETENTFVNASGTVSTASGWILSDYISVKGSTQYHFKPNSTEGDAAKLACYNIQKQFIGYFNSGERTFTTQADCAYMRFSYRSTSTNIQLELGSTATAYEPYIEPTTYTTDLPQTVYGGTLDVVSGVLTVDRAMVDLGTLTWSYWAQTKFFHVTLSDVRANTTNAICDRYARSDSGFNRFMFNGQQLRIYTEDYTDPADFKTAVNGAQLVYLLATPTTIQCDPQTVSLLAGENVVMGDGDMEITYRVKASA